MAIRHRQSHPSPSSRVSKHFKGSTLAQDWLANVKKITALVVGAELLIFYLWLEEDDPLSGKIGLV